jgi:HEAT repeat protein
MGPAAAPAVPQLIKALNDPELPVRLAAAGALGAIGPKASAAIPVLQDLARQHPDRTAAETILMIEGKEVPTYY